MGERVLGVIDREEMVWRWKLALKWMLLGDRCGDGGFLAICGSSGADERGSCTLVPEIRSYLVGRSIPLPEDEMELGERYPSRNGREGMLANS
jgi:hypothetical protein